MQHKRLKLTAVIILALGLTGLQAQESVTVTGRDATGSGGSVSYSVGQVVYQTHTGTNGSVSEGVQQPYEISVVTAIDETQGINLSVSAYPNPINDYLTLNVDDFESSILSYQLYDIRGKLLRSKRITGKQTTISMSNLVHGTYLVKVIHSEKEIKIFKIVKTQ